MFEVETKKSEILAKSISPSPTEAVSGGLALSWPEPASSPHVGLRGFRVPAGTELRHVLGEISLVAWQTESCQLVSGTDVGRTDEAVLSLLAVAV